MPTYNRLAFLKRAVESALTQEGAEDFEVVVLDNRSTDNTWKYLESLNNQRLRIFRNEKHLPMGQNWLKAVRLTKGEYVFVLQDDDLAMPRLAAKTTEVLQKYDGVDLICFSSCLLEGEDDTNRTVIWEPVREEIWPPPKALLYFAENWVLSSAQVIFSRATYDKYGEFDLTPPIMSDAEAILRWMVHARSLVVPEVLAMRRLWPGSVTSATVASREMVATMKYLDEHVSRLAEESGNLNETELQTLRALLQRNFVVRFQEMLERSRVPPLHQRVRNRLGRYFRGAVSRVYRRNRGRASESQ
jgi:hypothetical protein